MKIVETLRMQHYLLSIAKAQIASPINLEILALNLFMPQHKILTIVASLVLHHYQIISNNSLIWMVSKLLRKNREWIGLEPTTYK